MEESEGQWRMGCAQNVVKGEGEAERLFFFFWGGGECRKKNGMLVLQAWSRMKCVRRDLGISYTLCPRFWLFLKGQ